VQSNRLSVVYKLDILRQRLISRREYNAVMLQCRPFDRAVILVLVFPPSIFLLFSFCFKVAFGRFFLSLAFAFLGRWFRLGFCFGLLCGRDWFLLDTIRGFLLLRNRSVRVTLAGSLLALPSLSSLLLVGTNSFRSGFCLLLDLNLLLCELLGQWLVRIFRLSDLRCCDLGWFLPSWLIPRERYIII